MDDKFNNVCLIEQTRAELNNNKTEATYESELCNPFSLHLTVNSVEWCMSKERAYSKEAHYKKKEERIWTGMTY